MSTTKRSRTTKKKEPAKPVSRSAAGAKAKAAPRRAAIGKTPAEPVKKARSKKAVEPRPPPPSAPRATSQVASPASAYHLDGPVPAEAEGLPKKVGALLGIGQRALGIKTFRPGQAKAFEHLLAGEDLLAVMPTGSGKSLLYQLTSLVVPGVTVVVSPLIALIKDQLDKMVAKGVSACKVDSTLTVK